MPHGTPNIEVWFDGSLDNEGRASYGFMIANDDRVVLTCAGYIGSGPGIDSIAAEYAALDALLQYLLVSGITQAVVRGDCAPVIASVQGERPAISQHRLLIAPIAATRALLPLVRLEWIPRGLNSQAHILARAGLKNYALMKPWGGFNNSNGYTPKPKRRGAKIRRRARRFLADIINRLS